MRRSKRRAPGRSKDKRQTPETAVLLVGRSALDENDASILQRALDVAIEQASRVILDLAKVAHINSAIVAMLILEQRRARSLGKTLQLVGLSKATKVLLSVCHADTLFEAFATLEEALERSVNVREDDEASATPPLVIAAQLQSAVI